MKNNNYAFKIFFRYVLILILGLGNLFIFYQILSPLTIYPTKLILGLFYQVNLQGTTLVMGEYTISIIRACIAPSAFYLLLALNLSTPIDNKKRIPSIIFSFLLLLLLNISRIVILSIMFINENAAFDFTHKLLWYGLSTIFVVGIWFLTIYQFEIKEIPLYTDYLTFKKIIKK